MLPWGDEALARTTLIDGGDKAALTAFLASLDDVNVGGLAGRTAREWLDEAALPLSARLFVETQVRLVTYVADLDSVSADLVATQLRLDPIVDYLHDGWSQLVGRLAAVAERRGVRIHRGVTVRALTADGTSVVIDTNSDRVHASQIVLATGTPAVAARLLGEAPASWSRLGPPLETAALDLGLAAVPPRRVLLGLDRPLYLSQHTPPAHLAPLGAAVVHLLRYLRPAEQLTSGAARNEMLEHAALAGITSGDIEESRYLHRMVVVGGLPLAKQGGLSSRPQVGDTGVPGVFVAGDWVGPDGHLADAALSSGEAAGRAAARHALQQPSVAGGA